MPPCWLRERRLSRSQYPADTGECRTSATRRVLRAIRIAGGRPRGRVSSLRFTSCRPADSAAGVPDGCAHVFPDRGHLRAAGSGATAHLALGFMLAGLPNHELVEQAAQALNAELGAARELSPLLAKSRNPTRMVRRCATKIAAPLYQLPAAELNCPRPSGFLLDGAPHSRSSCVCSSRRFGPDGRVRRLRPRQHHALIAGSSWITGVSRSDA